MPVHTWRRGSLGRLLAGHSDHAASGENWWGEMMDRLRRLFRRIQGITPMAQIHTPREHLWDGQSLKSTETVEILLDMRYRMLGWTWTCTPRCSVDSFQPSAM